MTLKERSACYCIQRQKAFGKGSRRTETSCSGMRQWVRGHTQRVVHLGSSHKARQILNWCCMDLLLHVLVLQQFICTRLIWMMCRSCPSGDNLNYAKIPRLSQELGRTIELSNCQTWCCLQCPGCQESCCLAFFHALRCPTHFPECQQPFLETLRCPR